VTATADLIFTADDEPVREIAARCTEGWNDPVAVADMLNAAIGAGYTIAMAPLVVRKMKIEEGETIVVYGADFPRAVGVAMKNALVAGGAPASTVVVLLPTGQHVGLLTDDELASAGLQRLSKIIVPR
jgi:hypothetical protein